MSGVNVRDIDELDEFRAHLAGFNRDLAERFATMRARWHDLGQVWRDDLYGRFGDALGEVTPGIERYLVAAEKQDAYLRAFVERLRAVRELSGG